jgi:hypothetical protein
MRDKARDVIVRAGVAQDDPKRTVPPANNDPIVILSNLQRTGMPSQADKDRALDLAIHDLVRKDAAAFGRIASRGGSAPGEGVPRNAPPREVPIGPPPGVAFIDRMVEAHLPSPKPRPSPDERKKE